MKQITRLWDKDYNCLYSYEGDAATCFNEMTLTVDDEAGRKAGRIGSVEVVWLHAPSAEAAADPQEM